MLNVLLSELAEYAVLNGLIERSDIVYCMNRALHLVGGDAVEKKEVANEISNVEDILEQLTDVALANGMLVANTRTYRDILAADIMDCFTPMPSVIIHEFEKLYEKSPLLATNYFYKFSKSTNYIMTKRVAKDKKWIYNSKYGDLIITINLSKPEKDPRDIAAALGSTSSNYPKCQLCVENEGFEGNLSHPARANHRMIPVEINGENWYFQYSPYVYYNEHSILLYEKHVPMKTDIMTFRRLLGFVSKFKHYFIGSNADLPIVGGSILTHDHFQGGRADFPMSEAGVGCELRFEDFPEVSVGIVKWPLSTLRLSGNDCEELAMLGEKILKVWRGYSDLTCDIVAITDQPHNTVTPIARFRDGRYELDLILRNNRTSSEHPLGIFHPHSEYHHIKKENIGLIEAMGLAVLPSRLVNEFDVESDIVRSKIGEVFEGILENCGVYKETMAGKEGFMKFVATCGGCVVG